MPIALILYVTGHLAKMVTSLIPSFLPHSLGTRLDYSDRKVGVAGCVNRFTGLCGSLVCVHCLCPFAVSQGWQDAAGGTEDCSGDPSVQCG